AKDKRFGRDFLPFDVVERPAGGDAALGGGEEADLVDDAHALEAMAGLGDQARPAVEVVARREALLGDQRLALDDRAEGLRDLEAFHVTFPVHAISTQSAVRRRMVLKRCAPMMFTIFAELDTMLLQPFFSRIGERFCRM